MEFRQIQPEDDAPLAAIVRRCLEDGGLDVPGTVYFDPELDHLSDFYLADPKTRWYLVVVDDEGVLQGGVGLCQLAWDAGTVELQKLYLTSQVRGQGLGRVLMEKAEVQARAMGYGRLYLETHHNLAPAIGMYRHLGFFEIERPAEVMHSTMDTFFAKAL